ncbi:MAG: hypothetical protein Q7T36_05225 [Fluviicoccus sp.]|uniref:hypothetical protein n=1 Tax=Fluviicoccus sp. TaxID=2003552 RepID=UPI0027196A07|nr:hypothetical protein [Fluviicoccus sp.]MDO8329856.1 hypothetical protein [Fluviicoccus sp.]
MSDNINPYNPPKSVVRPGAEQVNTSGMGKDYPIPEGVSGWSWGAFCWNWIWGLGNKTYIALLAMFPYIGFLVALWMGFKGREMAWQNKRWDSVEHFNQSQRKWSMWAAILFGGGLLFGILAAVLVPLFSKH